MSSSRWEKQHIHFQKIVWGVSVAVVTLLIILILLLGYWIEMAGVFFLVFVAITSVGLAFLFKNRYANSMVRVLKADYKALDYDFRRVFKEKHIAFSRKIEEESYSYAFHDHSLIMTVQPHRGQLTPTSQPITKLTLYELTAKNAEFAEMLAGAIDEMADQQPKSNSEQRLTAAARRG